MLLSFLNNTIWWLSLYIGINYLSFEIPLEFELPYAKPARSLFIDGYKLKDSVVFS